MQQMDTTTRTQTNAQTPGAEANAQLTGEGMPSPNRAGILRRMTGIAVMSMAFAGDPDMAQAQAPATPPPTPSPATAPAQPSYNVIAPPAVQQFISTPVPVVPAPPAPAPAAAPAIDTTKSNVTVIENRPFCMDDKGNVLLLGDRRLQVNRVGQSVQGSPSFGESLRVIAEGVAHLKQMNGGVIPDGCNVKVVVNRPGAVTGYRINLDVVPDIKNLSPATVAAARQDPLTGQAITGIHENIHLHVKNVGGGLMTMTYKEKNRDTPLSLSVELEKR